jgi:hypothetical protein
VREGGVCELRCMGCVSEGGVFLPRVGLVREGGVFERRWGV